MLRLWLPLDWRLDSASAFGGTVAALGALWRGPVNLDQHGVIDICAKRPFNGFQIGLVAVRRELDAGSESRRDIVHEPLGAVVIPTADEVGNDEIGVGLDRGPRPCVAGTVNGVFHPRDAFASPP